MSKTTKAIIWVIILAVVVWGGIKLLSNQQSSTGPIKIGTIYGVSGPIASFGEQFKNGALLAVDEINKNGGIKGRNVELIIEDSQMDTKVAISAFNKLTDIDKAKYIHLFGSSISVALKPLAEEKKVVIFPSTTNPKITESSNFVLRHANTATSDALLIAQAVQKENPKKVGVIYLNDDFGSAFNDQFGKSLKSLAPNIDILTESHGQKDTDFRTQLTKIISFKPDSVVIASYGAAAGTIVKQLKELGYRKTIFENNGLILSTEAQKVLGEQGLKGIRYQAYADTPQTYKDLYKSKFGTDPGLYSLYIYTDFELLKYAIENVGDDPYKVVSFVKNLKTFKGKFETVDISPSGDIIIPTTIKIWE